VDLIVRDTTFYGRIYTGEFEVVTRILERWIAPGQLRTKIRMSGEEIEYDGERLNFYCHTAAGPQGGTPSYLLEGEARASLDETKEMLQRLLEICREMGVTATFEYVEVSEDGEELSEEFYIR
jgi:hypothetical protein